MFEQDLFKSEDTYLLAKNNQSRPLSDILRPNNLEDIVGQDHLFGNTSALTLLSKSPLTSSLVLWGPAGVGKTSIARILAKISKANFIIISAIESNTAEIKKIFQQAKINLAKKVKTILMIDEIHHFNKTQQDLFLPYIEDGTIILIATTTENPSFHLNSALLSRCKVLTLKSLDNDALKNLLNKAESFLDKKLPLSKEAREELISLACGDGRYLLNTCQELANLDIKEELNADKLIELISKRSAVFDKKGETHYNLISAFHKTLRGSDVDASLYYLARMLVAKQDPYYILRRMAKFATEDIGMADPQAVLQVMAAKEIYEFLGSPEGDYALSYAAIYLACAPKSNAAYRAHDMAIIEAKNSNYLSPPKHILNAPTKMMKDQGYGENYIYDHDTQYSFSGQEYFTLELLKGPRPQYYQPKEIGFEREIKKRVEYWQKLREKLAK